MSTTNQTTLASLLRAREKKVKPPPKPLNRAKGMTPEEKKQWEADKAFYAEIWKASPRRCEECGIGLGNEALSTFFHHLLEKEDYPQFRHTPENIMILCPDDHTQVHSNIDKTPRVKAKRAMVYKLLIG